MVPNIVVYAYNAIHEYQESEESKTEGLIEESAEQRADSAFFAGIATIYAVSTFFVVRYRNRTLPYYIILFTASSYCRDLLHIKDNRCMDTRWI